MIKKRTIERIIDALSKHGHLSTRQLASRLKRGMSAMSTLLHYHERAGNVVKVRPGTIGRNATPAYWGLP